MYPAPLLLYRVNGASHSSLRLARWGPVPDVLLALVPKFTIENRLPIGIQFRLSATRSRERSYTANPPLTAHPLPTIVPVSSDLEQTSDVPPSRVTVLSRSVSPPLQTTSEVATTMLPALTREASAPLGQTEPTSRPTELCTRMRDTLREVIDASPCAEALASSPCGAMHLGESQPLTQEMCEESLQREGSFYRTSEGEQRPQVVRTRREAAFNLGSDGDPVREEELIDGLPVGEHCEVRHRLGGERDMITSGRCWKRLRSRMRRKVEAERSRVVEVEEWAETACGGYM